VSSISLNPRTEKTIYQKTNFFWVSFPLVVLGNQTEIYINALLLATTKKKKKTNTENSMRKKERTELLSSRPPLTTSLPLRETTETFIFEHQRERERDPLHQMAEATKAFD
jgi:hypothetical protein